MDQNYPNPFNPSTTIWYALPNESKVKITIYNLLGQEINKIVNSVQQAGIHDVSFNAGNLSSGIYFYTISANSTSDKKDFKEVRKMLLLK